MARARGGPGEEVKCRKARPSLPANWTTIGASSAASSRSPRPLTQAEGDGRPSSPRASGVSSSIPSPSSPSPLLPRAPLCVRGLPRGTEGPAGAGAFSTLDLDSDWAPGEVGRMGARPPRSPPSLSTVLFSTSFPTLHPISVLSPESLRCAPRGPFPTTLASSTALRGALRPLNLVWLSLPCYHFFSPINCCLFLS